MTNLWKGIGWAILLSAILYFSYGVAYHVGYNRGQAELKCDRGKCMAEIIKYSKCDLSRTSNYPKLSNYKGVK